MCYRGKDVKWDPIWHLLWGLSSWVKGEDAWGHSGIFLSLHWQQMKCDLKHSALPPSLLLPASLRKSGNVYQLTKRVIRWQITEMGNISCGVFLLIQWAPWYQRLEHTLIFSLSLSLYLTVAALLLSSRFHTLIFQKPGLNFLPVCSQHGWITVKQASACCERSNSAVCECRKEGIEAAQRKHD